MGSVKRKSAKGKQHVVHAGSLIQIADMISDAASSTNINLLTSRELFLDLAVIFRREGERVRKIKR